LKISNLFYKYREDTKSFPPPPKSSLVLKVVDGPESCIELFGFVAWFDPIDLPFRLNKNETTIAPEAGQAWAPN
jgi:hypothetical protein